MHLAARQWLAAILLLMAAGLALNTLLGPLILDRIAYPFSETVRNQGIGLEAVSLALVVPWSIVAAALAWRGHPLGPILAVPPGGYTAYVMAQYVVGPGYLVYPHALALHLALFILGLLALAMGWALSPGTEVASPGRPRRYALLPLGLAAFVLSRYAAGLAGSFNEEPLPAEVAEDPAMYWSIVLLDLGVVVPAAVATAVALARASPVAAKALYALLGWFTLVPISVATMAVVMVINDDPYASTPGALTFSIAAAVFTAFAAWLHTGLTGPPPTVAR